MMHARLARSSRAAILRTIPGIGVRRAFSASPQHFENRIYDVVRNPSDLQTLLLLSSSSRTPLITLWKTSLCRSCAVVSPLIRSILEKNAAFTPRSLNVGYAEVELDSPDATELAMRYAIRSVPTLMAFDRQEAQIETATGDVEKMKNEKWLLEWIEHEASRAGAGGGGGSLFGRLFGQG